MDSLFLYGDLTIHITIKRGKYNVFTSKATLRDCMPIQIFINMGDLKAWLTVNVNVKTAVKESVIT